jgi:hypothetical protein
MATCTFGADQQRLQGEARDTFIKMHGGSGRLPELLPRPSNSAKTRTARPHHLPGLMPKDENARTPLPAAPDPTLHPRNRPRQSSITT